MFRNMRSWDEMGETGLRLCAEAFSPAACLPSEVTKCCWHPNDSAGAETGTLGLCGADGSFVLAHHGVGKTIAVCTYAVYFSTLPVHLWGRSQAGDDSRASPPVPSAPARRVERPWSQMAFVPGHPGEVVFVQGWSPRVLLTNLSTEEEDRCGGGTTLARGERFGLLEGSRVLALDGHGAHVRCLAIDSRGELLLTGDESGSICARLLHFDKGGAGRDGDGGSDPGDPVTKERLIGETLGDDGEYVKVLSEAHAGGVFAIRHVEDGDAGGNVKLFVSGGAGGAVRLWGVTVTVPPRVDVGPREDLLEVLLLTDMLVGGFQVTSLAASPSYRVPLVLAGTAEGTVFAFRMPRRRSKGGGGPGSGDGDAPPGVGEWEKGLGVLAMKFEHTSRPVVAVSCSLEQELIATADADGIVRTYRPLSPARVGDARPSQQGLQRSAGGATNAERGVGPVGAKEGSMASTTSATTRPFDLVVECRLGSRTVSCQFALDRMEENTEEAKEEVFVVGGERKHSPRRQQQQQQHKTEVLRTCTRDGSLRVWPVSSLPARPMRPASQQPRSPLTPPGFVGTPDGVTPSSSPAASPAAPTVPPLVAADERESLDPASRQRYPGVGRGVTEEEAGEEDWEFGVGGATGRHSRAAAEGGGSAVRREEAPLPRARPETPRRVTFAPAEEVYQIKDPSDEDGPWARGHRSEDFEIDGDLETPLPPPPSPTPAPDTTIAGPRRLRQSWGRSPRGSGAGGSSHSNGDRGDVSIDWRRQDRLEAGTGGGRGGGGGRRRPGKNREEVPVGMFVTPSRLQEASLCSTAVEQAALEQRMREEFHEGLAHQEPTDPVRRASATSVVNVPPKAITYEGLVPVSLDAPPPRQRRTGKQVSKAHLSKLEERRITEDDLAYADMEPRPSCFLAGGHGGFGGALAQASEELEWFGGRPTAIDFGDASMTSDRVWSLGLRS